MGNLERNRDTKLARALYTNTPEAKNELFFRKGDILTVIEFNYQGHNGWWLCSLLGERGICPGNYLQLMENDYKNVGEDGIPSYDVPKSYKGPSVILNTLDLYDVPKSQHPIYNSAAVVRAKKHGSGVSLSSTGSSNRVSIASSASFPSTSSSESSITTGLNSRFQKSPSPRPDSPIYANEESFAKVTRRISPITAKSSVQEHNPELDYDVPRSALLTSRRSSTVSNPMSGIRGCVRVDSKDNLDLYDVPRNVKNCVSLFENKYDHIVHRPSSARRRDEVKRSSICSSSSNGSSNPQSSIEKHFGVILRNAGTLRNAESFCSTDSRIDNSEAYDIPPSSRSESIQNWSAKSELDQPAYDMPAEFSRQVSMGESTESRLSHENFRRKEPLITATSNSSIATASGCHFEHLPSDVKHLPLCPKAAITVCEKLRQEVVTSILSILNLVMPNWRVKDNLKEIMPELRFGCVRLNLGVKDFTDFCSHTVFNSKKFGLESILIRLQKLLAPLTNGSQIIQKDVDELEAYLWSVDRLSVPANEKEPTADALDQLVLCARSLQYDVTEIANFIALNSSLIFQGVEESTNDTMKPIQEPEATVEDTQEDYDYVTLSSTEEGEKAGKLAQMASSKSVTLSSRDQQILDFYSAQIAHSAPLLSQSIATFISSVHQNDPPKVFNAHLKYVILLAYKMLFSGDTIHRNILNPEIRNEIELKSDELHKAVVSLHEASKLATRDFPKILPMQNIIDHVWETTSAATQLKKVIFNANM